MDTGDVSRETAGAELFGDRLSLAQDFAALLRGDGIDRGLIGPREADRLWTRHILNCAVVAPAIPTDAQLVDVGSGAGLPGVVLAIARPDLRIRLVEPLLRRATFLSEVVARLELGAVEVVRDRAENLHGQWVADVVTARAVAPLDRLARWCLPLVRTGGLVLALKGDRAEEELAAAEPDLRHLGAVDWRVVELGAGVVDPVARVVRIEAGQRPEGRRTGS